MASPGQRINKRQEAAKQQKRQSRRESRANIVNLKRNLVIQEQKNVAPVVLSEAEKLKLWRMEKKRKMDEEKLRRRPPFFTYINVKHTGLSPFRKNVPPTSNRRINKAEGTTVLAGSKTNTQEKRTVRAPRPVLENGKEVGKLPGKKTFNFHMPSVTAPENVTKPEPRRTTRPTIANKGATIHTTSSTLPLPSKATKPPLQVINTRSTRTAVQAAAKIVPVVGKKAVKIAQPTQKPVIGTKTAKKTDNNVKATLNKPVVTSKKESGKTRTQLKENKENIPIVTTLSHDKTCTDCGKAKQHNTRSTKKTGNAESSASVEQAIASSSAESPNGPAFQRKRLEEESAKLLVLKEQWLNRDKVDNTVPETIRDEILSVTGLTSLLISSKFEQFRSLIEDCAAQVINPNVPQRIVPDDLDGFWEMMYIQVVQLHNKYANLERLMMNNWKDPSTLPKVKPKKQSIRTPLLNKRRTRSRFQEFLNKRKEKDQNEEEKTLASSSSSETISTVEDMIAKVQEEANDDCGSLNLSSIKTCLATPKAMKNLLTARRSRRTSMNIIMSMSGLGKFDISGTALPSPKVEKRVTFANVD